MKSALVDVPVLILFFNRPQQLSQVFEQVKKARPSRLFLYQDGARNERDLPGIKACREVTDQIDWDKFNMQQLEQLIKERKFRSDFIYMCQRHREQQKAFYETIFHASILFNSGLSIVPTRNMINNLGATADSTHFAGSIHTLPKGYRRIFTMKRYEVDFPLKHPRYVIENVAYKESVYRIMGWDHPWIKIGRSFEELFLNLKYGNFSIITKAVKNRINKWLKRNKHH